MDGYNINIKIISPRTRDGSWAADQYVIVGPGFRGSLPSHFDDDHIIRSLSRFTFVLGQNQVYGPDDVPNVTAIQSGYGLAFLNRNEPQKYNIPVFPFVNEEELSKPVPEPQVFFSYPSFILDYIEIEDYESDLFKRFAKIKVGPSMEFIGQEMSQKMYKMVLLMVQRKLHDDVFLQAITAIDGWTPPLRSKILCRNYLERATNRDLYAPDPARGSNVLQCIGRYRW